MVEFIHRLNGELARSCCSTVYPNHDTSNPMLHNWYDVLLLHCCIWTMPLSPRSVHGGTSVFSILWAIVNPKEVLVDRRIRRSSEHGQLMWSIEQLSVTASKQSRNPELLTAQERNMHRFM
ncbi:hypothetical protein GOODEAATRI_011510 [Goodea atripinnis]|uniref:Uncharacterized protein n=1 Tax=Goodea atripinnis TaxID=208336 RepID=A0ABV0PDB5_9TELE